MSSYKHDGRIPRPKNLAQCRDTPSSVIAAVPSPNNVPVAHPSRSQIARPMSRPPTNRAASSSSIEENRRTPVLSRPSASAPSNHARPSFLPRTTNHPLPLTSSRPPAASRVMYSPNQAASNPHTSRSDTRSPVDPRPKNVLRRKAPTIGQCKMDGGATEASKPEKLSVIIPSSPTLDGTNTIALTPCDYADPIRQNSSADIPEDKSPKIPEPQAGQGPKELASLRTVNTQNLPPPTPSIPTAGSPSTRYSNSPGIWSRTSTPTSLSSCSPGIVHSAKLGYRLRQQSSSQTRLPTFSPPIQSSPQGDRLDLREPKLSNVSKRSDSNPSPLKTQLEGPSKNVDSLQTAFTSGSPPHRKPSISDQPKKANSDTEVQQKKDEAERRIFEPRRVAKTRTAESSADSIPTPSRPSREGTHRLELGPSPVIQSNLPPHSVTNHKRRESAESLPIVERLHPNPSQSAAGSVDSLQSRGSTRLPPRAATSPAMSRRSPQPLVYQKQETQDQAKSKRFGLFPRRSRGEVDPGQSKPTRKGPAAGTGYEGYGKYGQPGRRSSTSSNGSGTRSINGSGPKTSTNQVRRSRPDLDIDDFLLNRLEPVVINGGGMDGAALSRAQSEDSTSGLSNASSSGGLSKESRSIGYSSDSLATSLGEPGSQFYSRENTRNTLRKKSGRRGTPDDGKSSKRSGMLPKKTSQRTEHGFSRPAIPGRKSSITALPQTNGSFQSTNTRQEEGMAKQRAKGEKSRWNFFHRSRAKEQKHSYPDADKTDPRQQLSATISRVLNRRPVAHYALVNDDSDSLEDIMHKAEESPPTDEKETPSPVQVPEKLNIKKMRESVLLPSPPQLNGEFSNDGPPSPKVFLNKNPNSELPKEGAEKRASRLESIGRIPQVISRRDREHRPAQESFSRPFSITDSPSLVAPVTNLHDRNVPNDAGLNMHAVPPPTKPIKLGFDLTQPFGDPMQRSALDLLSGPYSSNEFLSFSRKTGSQHSSSSESGGLPATTAIPYHSAEPSADDVWGEYDDLIERFSPVASKPAGTRPGSGEKLGMATMASKTLQAELHGNADKKGPRIVEHPAENPDRTSSGSTEEAVRLRRSKIITALHSPLAPSSQPSYSSIIAAYESGESVDVTLDHKSTPKQLGRQSSLLLPPSLPATVESDDPPRQKNTTLFDIAEGKHEDDPTMQTNLRSGSLMTSRWLSFGRVLFSPAHNHMKTKDQQRILVIDGLGNDDWSFYCSLTYPNAEVYILDLGPAPTTSASTNPSAWKPPTNHHTIQHVSLERSFPFPRGFFAVTVLRFPAACSERVQDNIVSECKRVLRPGGYMELGILDLDMVTMGSRTRKAVRTLKERTYLSDSTISLKPASDNIQRLLGLHGFDNLHRCMVRVPVAGMIVRTSDSSSSSSSRSIPKPPFPKPPAHKHSPADATVPQDQNLSLGDLLSDPSSPDESIRKIVAKVGRWWYSRCYEIPTGLLASATSSIWDDKKVLRECQREGTGFRLLIAYAQKPSEKRRTASV